MSSPAAWHPDPSGKHDHRWWDGERWTEHVADAGQASVDPLDAAPPAPGGGAPAAAEGGTSPGGWAQGASDQGRDPDADGGGQHPGAGAGGTAGGDPGGGGLAGGGLSGGAAWEQPGGSGAPGQADAGGQASGTGQYGGSGQYGHGDTGQYGAGPGGAAWQGGQSGRGGPVWDQPGGGAPSGSDQPTWQQGAPAQQGSDGVAITAMIVGILAILVSWVPVLGAIVGIAALVLGLVGRGRIKKSGARGNGMAVTGIATGAVAIAINLAIIAFFVVAGGDFFEEIGSYADCIEETGDEALCQQRLEDGIIERFGS